MVSEELEQLFMAAEHCKTESLPRIWAIEALACSKQLDTSELIDFIRRTPELSDDIGKNARELLSLRILETLFVEGNQNDNEDASALHQKIKFDPSSSCEDVLHHILLEMSALNLKLGASDMLKWDVKSFIAHKRDCLPVVALQKLKGAVLEGSQSVFASLKERSGVVVRTQRNDNIPGNVVNPNTPWQRFKERSYDTQIVFPNQNSSPNTREKLQEKLPAGNSLPSKRNRTDISTENLEREDQIMQNYRYDPYAESTKRFKQDIHIADSIAVEKSIKSARDGVLANSCDRIIEGIDREVCNLENEAKTGGMEMEHSRSPHDVCNQHAAEKLKQVVNISEHATVVKSTTPARDETLANSSERAIEHIDREGCSPEKDAEIGGTHIKYTDSTNVGDDQFAALKMLARSSDICKTRVCNQHAAEKLKQVVNISEHATVVKSKTPARDEPLANSSEGAIEHIDREGCNPEKDAEIGGTHIKHTDSTNVGDDQFAALKMLARSSDICKTRVCNQHAAEKLKQVVNISEHATVVKSKTPARDEPLANSSERAIEHIDREGCNPEKDAEIGGTHIKHTDSTNVGDDQFAALKMLARSSDVVDGGDLNCQLQNPIDDNMEVNMLGELQDKNNLADEVDKSSNGTFLGANEECNNMNEAIDTLHHNLQGNTSTGCEANDGTEHNQVPETATGRDNYHDERKDIAAKMKAFLSSQCTHSEDTLETQPNSCIKCNRGEQLLICSSRTCPLVIHENCLGTATKLDGNGKFYCPFCAYSRALSEYSEAKMKVSLARQDLSTFIRLKVGCQPDVSIRSHRSIQNEVRGADDLCENNETNIDRDPLDEVVHTHIRPNEEDKLQAEPSISGAGNGLPCGETVADLILGEPKTLENGSLQVEGREQQCKSPFQSGEQQIEVQAPHKSDNDISSHKQAEIVHKNERQAVTRGRKKVILPPDSSLSSEPPCQTSCGSSEEDDDKSSASKYSMRSRRQEMQYTYPAIPQLRRKRHPWTKAEEERLKEGVQKYSSPEDLSIPWKAILEFGAGVFEKGRTTVDLKDKWRNMCKAASKSK